MSDTPQAAATEPPMETWLSPADRAIIDRLGRGLSPAPLPPKATESPAVRIALAATAPAWAAGAVALALASRLTAGGGPLLLMHRRVGHTRRAIWVPKVPTLSVPGNRPILGGLVEYAEGVAPVSASPSGFARWLRSTGLDELPQLGLVVAGTMRLVGPRPVTPAELAEMTRCGTPAVDRLAPGILGVWQLLERDDYDLAQRQALDEWMLAMWQPTLVRRIVSIGLAQAARRVLRSF